MNDALVIAVIEWDGSMDPACIVGSDVTAVLREIVRQVTYTPEDAQSYTDVLGVELPAGAQVAPALAWEDGGWLVANPFPDGTDAVAIREWLDKLHDDFVDTFTYTVYLGPAPTGSKGTTMATLGSFQPGGGFQFTRYINAR